MTIGIPLQNITVSKVLSAIASSSTDTLAVEEPLEISIDYGSNENRLQKNISVTMRTPGNDADLALGFLFTEGIIDTINQIQLVEQLSDNKILVKLKENIAPKLQQSDRNFYTTSSCGVCGKGSIDAIKTVSPFAHLPKEMLHVDLSTIYQLSEKLRAAQESFSSTGGIHASGLFTPSSELLFVREDVGRHNALDKLIGNALVNQQLPLHNHLLLLSGRASFELIQKAAMAGIGFVAAIGAPSSLAVDLAKELDITLLGFLKAEKFNIYHLSKYIQIQHLDYEN